MKATKKAPPVTNGVVKIKAGDNKARTNKYTPRPKKG